MLAEVMVLLVVGVEEFQLTFSVGMMTLQFLYTVRLTIFFCLFSFYFNKSCDKIPGFS